MTANAITIGQVAQRAAPKVKALACALLALASCTPRQSGFTPPEAAYEGQRTAYQLSLARDCGADRTKWDAEMKIATAPGFSGVYSAAFDRGMAIHRGRQPSEQECASIRQIPRFAELFEPAGRPPLAPTAKPRGRAAPTPGDAAPGYCPGGALAAEMTDLDAGKEILRARCRVGDSLIFHASSTGLIASVCDMSKPISSAGGNVFCTMGPIRQTRPSP